MTVDPDASALDIASRLADWREHGADRIDPLRFHLIEALARRAAGQGGAARRVLDARLRDLIAAYETLVAQAGAGSASADPVARAATALAAGSAPAAATASALPTARRPLVDLLNYIQQQTAESDAHRTLRKVALQRATYPELPEIDYFRDALSKVSTNRQVRQSLERVPENAGPLNSSHLVHRSLLMMRELSPGYLRHFLAYVDGLSWMEQVNAFGMPMGKDAAKPGAARKTSRAKAK
ncbi:DUF2894 domain-containing protein [Pigmentiphaga litoralis]|uniref:DUF2894 domain-containing protein n=1 Tax=Pigmentiphaga litoralis TaxID=516702 RepID=A0A7Y9IYR0_9BURK|nr:DUF2894 domain-containing protein [Pigmentiphaga litoralis]NYE26481.1 hypothetical protein [Pigmentiphaga litoralis]NYE85601.1 hypothetical protein [Pigmentiphaga litoralis]